jgi:hypothetical protein
VFKARIRNEMAACNKRRLEKRCVQPAA